MEWEKQRVIPDVVIERIRPGTRVCLSTGAAEPRTLAKQLMAACCATLQGLGLIMFVRLAEAMSLKSFQSQSFILKTFFSGWVADEAITAGHVDLIQQCGQSQTEIATYG